MKLTPLLRTRSHPSQRGSAVLVMLIFLVLMFMLCVATSQAIYSSRQEISLIEKQQLARLAASTNAAPATSRSISTP